MNAQNVAQSLIDEIDLSGTVYLLRRSRGDYFASTIEPGDTERFLGAQDSEAVTGIRAELGMSTTRKTLGEALEIARAKGLDGVWLFLTQTKDFQVFRA